MKSKNLVSKISISAIGSALVFVITSTINVPIGATNGYLNLGDAIILLFSLLFGPYIGAISGAIGASIADLLIAPQWAIFTFFIKAIEGLVCGYLFKKTNFNTFLKLLLSTIVSVIIMVGLYFLVSSILYSVTLAFEELVMNVIQAVSSVIIAIVIFLPTIKIPYVKLLSQKTKFGGNKNENN